MFERYTEPARRAIFFGRYEASQFGSPYIETEHLLLGLFRQDKALANQFLTSCEKLEDIRRAITLRGEPVAKISTSVDLPLSHESKRVLAYAAEEAERMKHKHIETAHLLLGLLREEKSFAARLLNQQGLTADLVRREMHPSEPASQAKSGSLSGLDQWLVEVEAQGGFRVIQRMRGARFALYAADSPKQAADGGPADKLAEIQKRIESIGERMERAIADHQFEKARFYADEERKERESVRRLREEFHLEEPQPQAPLVCIEVIGDALFSDVMRRCDLYTAEGAGAVWLLDAAAKRAYTVAKSEGPREFKGNVLRIESVSLEMDLEKVF
jgi:hypothetical protein